jgi:hypothetical protein
MARRKSSTSTTAPIPRISDFLTDGIPNQECWDYISTLASVVITKYFYKYLEHFSKDDLCSLATTDCVAFFKKVAASNSDAETNNLRNILFTRIRNSVSNFVFRSNRLVSTEDEVLDRCVVYPKSFEIKSDLIDMIDLTIDSIDSFREISLRTWNLFKSNGSHSKNQDGLLEDIKDWEAYSEVKNMKTPCDLISIYDDYTDDQIENLAKCLDASLGQNYFSTLYQLLGDKFLPFLDVFQEDKFNIPSTSYIKNLLTDLSILEDHEDGLSVADLSNKYDKTPTVIERILKSKDVLKP